MLGLPCTGADVAAQRAALLWTVQWRQDGAPPATAAFILFHPLQIPVVAGPAQPLFCNVRPLSNCGRLQRFDTALQYFTRLGKPASQLLRMALPKRIVHGMTLNRNMPQIAPVAPYSRMFSRGSLGSDIDGRSREGKFIRRVEAELAQHIGGEPNFAQRLLIRRAARAMLRLELLDSKMGSGDWTPHDAREFGTLNNALRLCLKELGIQPSVADKAPPSLDAIAARHTSPKAAPA